MNYLNLSFAQKLIVDSTEGAYLVLASAGSGKTRVLTERIKILSDANQGKILAITFTNKAAAEIKERLGYSETMKNVFVGTFHSFCQSILEVRFKLLGYTRMPHIFEDDSDRIELIKEVIRTIPYFYDIYEKLDNSKKNLYTYEALQFISTVKRELISPSELAEKSENNEFGFLFEAYQDILRSHNAIDFDDILKLVYELFTNVEAVTNLYRRAYNYICVDESQDLNKLQYFLLKALCGNEIKNVMLVGDPNQSIYGFNGSASSYMNNDFVKDFGASVLYLEENYRCSSSIIRAANLIMDLKVEAAPYVIDGAFEIQGLINEKDEADYVINRIKLLVELQLHGDIEGNITYSRFSILARNRFVFKQVEESLKFASIPYYFKSGNQGLKFASPLMKIFDLFLRIKINPFDRLHQKQLEDILKVASLTSDDILINSQFPIANNIKQIIEAISIETFHLSLEKLRLIFDQELFNDDDEKKLAIDELEEFKQQFVQYKKQTMKPTLEGFKSSLALGLTNANIEKSEGVCLSTVHTMKGQESEIVFLIGMDDGTFPDFRAIKKGGAELLQERNNVYVAFTRAKRFLFVTYPKTRSMPWGDIKPRQISRFLIPFNHPII